MVPGGRGAVLFAISGIVPALARRIAAKTHMVHRNSLCPVFRRQYLGSAFRTGIGFLSAAVPGMGADARCTACAMPAEQHRASLRSARVVGSGTYHFLGV